MIDSIGNAASMRPPPPPKMNENAEITDDQKALIEQTLAEYDADNLSQSDAKDIANTFKEAGIEPNKAFSEALSEVGFDAKEIRDLARGEKGQRPPKQEESSTGLDLSSVTSFLDSVSTSNSNGASLSASIAQKFGISEGQSLINVTA